MNTNPYKTPEPSVDDRESGESIFSTELLSVMLWSNVGLIFACLLFYGLDWIYVNWGGWDARKINIAWSKLVFILFGANVIIFFAYINRETGKTKTRSVED